MFCYGSASIVFLYRYGGLNEYLTSFINIHNLSDGEIFCILLSCNNGAITKAVCKFGHPGFGQMYEQLGCIKQIV